MATQLNHSQRAANRLGNAGNARTVRGSHLNDGATMNAGNGVTVYSKSVPSDKIYAWGAGSDNRQVGRDAFVYADLVDTDGNDIKGDLEYVITDSEQRDVHARGELGDLETLADAREDQRTERPQMPVTAPIARRDQHIELRVVADTDSDGVTLDRDASEVRLYYTDILD